MLYARLQLSQEIRPRFREGMTPLRSSYTFARSAILHPSTMGTDSSQRWMLPRSRDAAGSSVVGAVIIGILAILLLTFSLWFCIWLHHRRTDTPPATLPPSPETWSHSFSPVQTSTGMPYGLDTHAREQQVRHELGV
jgi:hypothetical protein